MCILAEEGHAPLVGLARDDGHPVTDRHVGPSTLNEDHPSSCLAGNGPAPLERAHRYVSYGARMEVEGSATCVHSAASLTIGDTHCGLAGECCTRPCHVCRAAKGVERVGRAASSEIHAICRDPRA
eukprot:1557174-Prymnesium_polylepis.1